MQKRECLFKAERIFHPFLSRFISFFLFVFESQMIHIQYAICSTKLLFFPIQSFCINEIYSVSLDANYQNAEREKKKTLLFTIRIYAKKSAATAMTFVSTTL